MRISNRFPVAVHTVMIIAALSEERKINSDVISEGIGVNAVVVRNLFISLKKAGIIDVSPGPGGAKLARSPDTITLWDILMAAEPSDKENVFRFGKDTSDHGSIGSNIYGILKNHTEEAVRAMKYELSKVTISSMVDELREMMPQLPSLPDRTDSRSDSV